MFLRGQSGLTVEMQKEFVDLLGKLSGRPETSGLHVHPLIEGKRDVGVNEKNDHDEKISVISSQLSKKLAGGGYGGERYMNAKRGWHSEYVQLRTMLPSSQMALDRLVWSDIRG